MTGKGVWFFSVCGARRLGAPHIKKRFRFGVAGGRRPPLRMRRKDGVGAAFGRPARRRVSLCHSERSEESVSPVLLRNWRAKRREYGFFGLRPQNDGERCVALFCVGRDDSARPLRGRQNPFLFPCWKKKRFLESKEKGAFESWGAVGRSAAAPVFTPPLGTSPGRYGLC